MSDAARCARVATEKVDEAARAICQARCAARDRDINCQEAGRCGDNWHWFRSVVSGLMAGSVLGEARR